MKRTMRPIEIAIRKSLMILRINVMLFVVTRFISIELDTNIDSRRQNPAFIIQGTLGEPNIGINIIIMLILIKISIKQTKSIFFTL